ncbi:non-ribosomal peptide synthetase, partial [Asaia sp. W19]|uniref:non-ribosomal peptide synthetase n=3 Tax=unclassified Asaia TaxID=2685023 RepID=UPI000F8E1E2A
MIALLAILKAGGAYLPLDPSYASGRLQRVLDDARPAVLLHDASGLAALGDWAAHDTILCNVCAPVTPWQAREAGNPDRHRLGLTSRNLAYIIYTSGSTGQPKGVAVEHVNAVALHVAQKRDFAATCRSRVLQFSSCSFDASIFEIVMALTAGAELCLITQEQRQSVETLWQFMDARRITHAVLPQALFRERLDLEPLSALSHLVFGGEALDPDVVRYCASLVSAKIINAYGPTEASVYASCWECPRDITGLHSVPIGRPIANTQLYILDPAGHPVPPGVSGELHIGGHGVARGYLNQPELTAERFIADPFCADGRGRLYRTGDLACYQPDGTILFLGRIDHQIKIRGFRVEPGEIETRLQEQPGLRAAAVILREDRKDDPRLVAYVVPEPGHVPDSAALRNTLAHDLPDYMVPSAIVALEALPLTTNGKLDRKALPVPDCTAVQIGRAPRTPREAVLCSLFAELLDRESVDIDTSFFDLGGHSLLATRLISRIRTIFSVSLPIRIIFEAPTVCALATAMEGDQELSRLPLTVQ